MCHTLTDGGIRTSSVTLLGESSLKRASAFLCVLTHVPFPLADFALDPFDEIHRSCRYDYMLSSVSLPGELQKPGVVLGTQDTFLLIYVASLFPLLLLDSLGAHP